MIFLQIIAVATSVVAIQHLLSLVPVSKKTRKKRFLKRLIRSIESGKEGLWAMDLRISSNKVIREGIRRLLDQTSNQMKGIEEELDKKCGKNKTFVKLIKMVEVIFPPIQPGMTQKEYREEGTIQRRKKWDEEIQKILEMSHGEDRAKQMTKEKLKEREEIFKMIDVKANLKIDSAQMTDQMFGKFSPREGVKIGGIDQENKEIQEKLKGGLSFIIQIKKEIKKI